MYLLSSSRLFEIFESPRCCVWSRQSRAAPSWQRLFMGLRYPKPVILRLKSRKALCCGRFRLLNIVSEESVASRMPRHSLQALPIQSESAGKLVSSGAPTSLAEIFVLQRSHNKSLTRHFYLLMFLLFPNSRGDVPPASKLQTLALPRSPYLDDDRKGHENSGV